MSNLIHDHFDGSLHCIECKGPCQLTGSSLAITGLVRNVCEYFALHHDGWIPPGMESQLATLLAPEFPRFREHALRAAERWKKATKKA